MEMTCHKCDRMRFKDYRPIMFEIFQTDMERIMYNLNAAIEELKEAEELKMEGDKTDLIEQMIRIKSHFQHMIEQHKERGEWL